MTSRIVSEEELDRLYATRRRLRSGGDYGCDCLVIEGDVGDARAFDDGAFRGLQKEFGPDLGTILVTGDVVTQSPIYVTDRLMCLVVLGSLSAPSLHVFDTEVLIGGRLSVGAPADETLVHVEGERAIG